MSKDVKLTYIDTDSFVLYIIDSSIYKVLKENKDLFDFSNYLKNIFYILQPIKKLLLNLKTSAKEI